MSTMYPGEYYPPEQADMIEDADNEPADDDGEDSPDLTPDDGSNRPDLPDDAGDDIGELGEPAGDGDDDQQAGEG